MKNKFKNIFLTKNKYALSLVIGAISSLAMPPFCAVILLFITFPVMLHIFEHASSKKQAFWCGWLFGLGYFSFGLYWISNAIIDDFPYFVPFAVLGLPMYLSIYTGLAGLITKVISNKIKGILLVLCFSCVFSLLEIARGLLFTGFPWNLTVYTWSNYLSIMQGVYYFGIYGFSFVSILVFSLLYLFLCKNKKLALGVNILNLILLITLGVTGNNRIENNQQISIFDKKVLVVQPSLPLEISNLDSMKIFDEYYLQTITTVTPDVDMIVWGETAIPFAINENPKYLNYLSNLIPKGAVLLSGSIKTDENGNYYNSIVVINDKGDIIADYDKSHLVPFGEYMPLGEYINLEKIVGFDFIFSKGKGRKTIKIEGLPSFSPLVCYEIIFPNSVIDKKDKPEFIFNVSNDTFYGLSTGPYQHFAMAKAQAIANNLPIIRVGNNGISGIINKVGQVQDFIGLGEKNSKLMSF